MSDLLIFIGEKIRMLRKKAGYTQEQLASRAGINDAYIGNVERGERNISVETLDKIMKALDISLIDFFKFENIPTNNVSDKNLLLEIHKNMLFERDISEIKKIHDIVNQILSFADSKGK